MNVLLVVILIAVAYLLYESGYVFFAMVVGIVLAIMLIASLFSARSGGKMEEKAAAPEQVAAMEEPLGPYAVKGYTPWERVFMAAGGVFNFVGKTVYRAFFNPSKEKHYHGKIKIKVKDGEREEKIKIKFEQDDE